MKTIRRFVYAAALTISALNFAPTLASAQDARGTFKLAHEVHWQNNLVPAGEYAFTVESKGPSELLLLRKISGTSAGFMMLIHDAEPATPSQISKLLLVSRPGGSFVSTMELPDVGITLHFTVPPEAREMAKADTPAATAAAQ